MLNIMGTFQPAAAGAFSAPEMHTRIEAMKLAYADLRRYNADPHTSDIPVARLLSKEWAQQRAALIDPKSANCLVPAGKVMSGRHNLFNGGRSRRQYGELD